MALPIVLQDDAGIRPAGRQDECFYCQQKIGTPHLETCVILQQKVKIRYSFEIEIDVPAHWDRDNIEFHRNEGSWCADNAYDAIESFVEEKGLSCSCSIFKAEVIEQLDPGPFRYNKKQERVP